MEEVFFYPKNKLMSSEFHLRLPHKISLRSGGGGCMENYEITQQEKQEIAQ